MNWIKILILHNKAAYACAAFLRQKFGKRFRAKKEGNDYAIYAFDTMIPDHLLQSYKFTIIAYMTGYNQAVFDGRYIRRVRKS